MLRAVTFKKTERLGWKKEKLLNCLFKIFFYYPLSLIL